MEIYDDDSDSEFDITSFPTDAPAPETTTRKANYRKSLSKSQTLNDVYQFNNLAETDVIGRREQVLMYKTVTKSFADTMHTMINNDSEGTWRDGGGFDQALILDETLEKLKGAFKGLQVKDELRTQESEVGMFEKAQKKLLQKRKVDNTIRTSKLEALKTQQLQTNDNLYAIKQGNLQGTLNRLHKPLIKWSKKRMELKNSELRLIELKQYADAKNCRRMLSVIDKAEIEAYELNWKEGLERKVTRLNSEQTLINKRLHEKLLATAVKNTHIQSINNAILNRNISNKKHDMEHEHTIDRKLKPELTIKPSLLLTKRLHHGETSSKFRGTQLLNRTKNSSGNSTRTGKMVSSLVDVHVFGDKVLLSNGDMGGTRRFEEREVWGNYRNQDFD